ncbi:hypothetical protein ACFL0D_03145 [Thermoproteota archaeon]
MNENTKKVIIFSTLILIWGALIIHIMSGSLGLTAPVFPRPQPDYALLGMLLSGVLLVGYSLKTGINHLRST